MKRSIFLLLGALALLSGACEKHPAQHLPPEHASAFGEHAWPPKAGHQHHAPHAGEHAAPPVAAPETPAAEPKVGEAPKFFPEKK